MYLKGGLHVDMSEGCALLTALVLVGLVGMFFYMDTHAVDSMAVKTIIGVAKSLAGGLS